MKPLFVVLIVLVLAFCGIYQLCFYIMPSVEVINVSNETAVHVTVSLPASHLDFGTIDKYQSNEIHYSLEQNKNGAYEYYVLLSSGAEMHGLCGYVTSDEINKRVLIEISQTDVICTEVI